MADNEYLDELAGEVSDLEHIEGDLEAEGDLDGDIEIPKTYVDDDYNVLRNKPAINGHILVGDQTAQELEIDCALTSELDITRSVGGVSSGTVYPEGTTLESIMREMFNPIEYPSFTNPSASVSATGNKLQEMGAVVSSVVTVSFNRGTINPAYGTSGYRSGPAISYSLNGGPEQSGNSFFAEITSVNNTLRSVVKYSEGEQPKDSVGNDYDAPLPAGQVQSGVLSYEFVNALWANTANIQQIAKLALVSKSAKVKEFSFPEQTVLYPEVFDVPASWNITAIEVQNPLSGKWESASGEFDITPKTHLDAGGNETDYNRYTDNRGYNAGPRTIRIKWS